MDALKGLLSKPEEKEPSLWDDINNQFSLTIQQRAIGFGISFGIGLLLAFIAFMFFGFPTTFALCYTLGNICMICSTAFIVGPVRQIKNMFAPTRFICTIVFFLSMIFTLVCVFLGWTVLLVILSVIIQLCAVLYYCFSYIPYGRTCLRNLCGGVVSL